VAGEGLAALTAEVEFQAQRLLGVPRRKPRSATGRGSVNKTIEVEADVKPTETLLYQLLETEQGGVAIYEKALECIIDESLREEFTRYLQQTEQHVVAARKILEVFGFDPEEPHPAREMCRIFNKTLLRMMDQAIASGDRQHAQLVAAGCVVEAETQDHMNWELAGELAKHTNGNPGKILRAAYEKVEEEEDGHLYRSRGWARELWMQALGLATLPVIDEQPLEPLDDEDLIEDDGQETPTRTLPRRSPARSAQH